MRTKITTVLLAAFAAAALAGAAGASASTIAFENEAAPLAPGAKVEAKSVNGWFEHSMGTSNCQEVRFEAEVVTNNAETASLKVLGAVEFPYTCVGTSMNITVTKGTFVPSGNLVFQQNGTFKIESPLSFVEELGGLKNKCSGKIATSAATWSGGAGNQGVLGINTPLVSEKCGILEFHSGSLKLTTPSGKTIEVVVH